MKLIVGNMKWIMLVCGLLTCTMVYAAISPQAALLSNFGDTLEGPLAEIIVRNWGALIALVGAMLIFGAFRPASRPLVLVVAGVSKAVFIGLILAQGSRFLDHARLAIIVDSVMVAVFIGYLITTRGRE